MGSVTSSFANLSDLQQAFSALMSLVSRNSRNSGLCRETTKVENTHHFCKTLCISGTTAVPTQNPSSQHQQPLQVWKHWWKTPGGFEVPSCTNTGASAPEPLLPPCTSNAMQWCMATHPTINARGLTGNQNQCRSIPEVLFSPSWCAWKHLGHAHLHFFTAWNMLPSQLLPSGTPVGSAGVGQRRERLPGL